MGGLCGRCFGSSKYALPKEADKQEAEMEKCMLEGKESFDEGRLFDALDSYEEALNIAATLKNTSAQVGVW